MLSKEYLSLLDNPFKSREISAAVFAGKIKSPISRLTNQVATVRSGENNSGDDDCGCGLGWILTMAEWVQDCSDVDGSDSDLSYSMV